MAQDRLGNDGFRLWLWGHSLDCPQKCTWCAYIIFFNLNTHQPDFDDSKGKTLVLSETNMAQGSLGNDGGTCSHLVAA